MSVCSIETCLGFVSSWVSAQPFLSLPQPKFAPSRTRRKRNYNSQDASGVRSASAATKAELQLPACRGALRPAGVNRGRSLESPATPIRPRKIGAGGPGTIPAMLRRLTPHISHSLSVLSRVWFSPRQAALRLECVHQNPCRLC